MAIDKEDADDLKAIITRLWYSGGLPDDDMFEILTIITDNNDGSYYRIEDIEAAIKKMKESGIF